ncbi:MAG TPA: hypothetical protein VM123_16370 [archaeon]|nr:hypothetical protein [archaeon]
MPQVTICFSSYKELFDMLAQIATVLAMGFAGWALFISARATKLQRDAIQTTLFSDFYKSASEILSQRPASDDHQDKNGIGAWCVMFLAHLEYLASLVRRNHISFKLAETYRATILAWCDDVLFGQPEALKEHYQHDPEAFSDLKWLYAELKDR